MKILSLDLGVTSCGYSVMEEKSNNSFSLLDYGVVMRDNPYDGGTQQERREKKQSRDLLDKKKIRLKNIKELFQNFNLYYQDKKFYDIWKLRALDAFERKLENDELFAIFRFLAKHRGYKSLKIEDLIAELDAKNKIGDCESGYIQEPEDTQKFSETLAYLDAMICKYPDKTAAQIIWELEQEKDNPTFRNHSDYRYMIRREHIEKEISKILNVQHSFGLFDTEEKKKKFLEELQKIIIEQDSVTLNEDNINNCLIYKKEKCAPLFSYSFDLFQIFKLVNDLKVDGVNISQEQKEELSDALISSIENLKAKEKFSVKDIKKILGISDQSVKLNNFYETKKIKGKDTPNILLKFNFVHILKKLDQDILQAIFKKEEFIKILDLLARTIHLNVNPQKLVEDVVNLFTLYNLDFSKEQIQSFVLAFYSDKKSGTSSYSFKALNELFKHMKGGKNESDAKEMLGVSKNETYEHFSKGIKYLKPQDNKGTLLYEIDENRISNHVVKSLVFWALRVIIDLHQKYGAFDIVKLESTRELSQPDKVKNDIKRANDKSEKEWQQLKERYKKYFEAKGLNVESSKEYILKLKLWEQQKEMGIYSHKPLSVDEVLSPQTEIEHIVPRTSGGSSAEYNLALDLKTENAQKGKKLPLDYLNNEKRETYTEFVKELKSEHKINFKKFKNLMAESLADTYKEAKDDVSLHATSYTEKLLGEILKRYYPFTQTLKENQRVMHIAGRATSYLRRILSIDNKSRDTNFHHAEDAILIGIMSKSYLQNISTNFEKNYELTEQNAKDNFKKIVPLINGAVPNEVFSHIRQSYNENMEKNPFYKGLDGRLKVPAFWVSKKPIGTKAHNETIQSKKNLSYYVPISSLLDKVKPNHKMGADDFAKKFNKEIYEKIQVVKDNPKDHTAKEFARKRDVIINMLNQTAFINTKEEFSDLDKALRDEMVKPLYDVNGNAIRRVKRVGEDASIEVRKGLAYTAPSLVCLRCSFIDEPKLTLQRMDIRSYAKNKVKAHYQMDIFNNDLIEVYVYTSKQVQFKCLGLLKGFTESKGGRINIRHPKYPLLKDKQPELFTKEISIGSTCGVKKYKTDAVGNILGFYYLGRVLDGDKELFAKVLSYKAM